MRRIVTGEDLFTWADFVSRIESFLLYEMDSKNYEYKKFGMQVVYMYNKIESLKRP